MDDDIVRIWFRRKAWATHVTSSNAHPRMMNASFEHNIKQGTWRSVVGHSGKDNRDPGYQLKQHDNSPLSI